MYWLISGLRGLFVPRLQLVAQIVCLRQQLAALQRQRPHPQLTDRDRRFWILMSRWFSKWKGCLVIVRPETVLGWHRHGWRY